MAECKNPLLKFCIEHGTNTLYQYVLAHLTNLQPNANRHWLLFFIIFTIAIYRIPDSKPLNVSHNHDEPRESFSIDCRWVQLLSLDTVGVYFHDAKNE